MSTKNTFNDYIQWLVLTGIVLGKYVETAIILLLFLFCKKKFSCPKTILLIVSLLAHFFLTDIVTSYPTDKFLQQFLVISILLLGYYQFYHNYVPSMGRLWRKYMKVALWVCYIGYIQFAIFLTTGNDYIGGIFSQQKMIGDERTRMTSIFLEPGNFAAFIVPAVAYCFLSNESDLKKRDKALILIAMLLSFTTIGYFMLVVILLYHYRKIIIRYIYVFLFPIVILGGLVINYSLTGKKVGNPLFDGMLTKFSNSIQILGNLSFDNLALSGDLSTYAIFSNLWVAEEAPCRLTGTGLGTHELNYGKIMKYDGGSWYGINKDDAYSLFTRVFSEFGCLGVLLGICFLYKYRNARNPINVALLFYFISLLIRGGYYFLYGVIFFFYLYYYTSEKKQLNYSNGKNKKYCNSK